MSHSATSFLWTMAALVGAVAIAFWLGRRSRDSKFDELGRKNRFLESKLSFAMEVIYDWEQNCETWIKRTVAAEAQIQKPAKGGKDGRFKA